MSEYGDRLWDAWRWIEILQQAGLDDEDVIHAIAEWRTQVPSSASPETVHAMATVSVDKFRGHEQILKLYDALAKDIYVVKKLIFARDVDRLEHLLDMRCRDIMATEESDQLIAYATSVGALEPKALLRKYGLPE